MNFGFKNNVKRWKNNFKDDTYFSLFKKIQNFPGFFSVRIYRAFWEKIGQKKFNFQIFGDRKLKKKVFSWVVVFDFMVLILFQKVLWHHKMCSDSKISSQKISEDTLSCSKSMLSIHEKNWKNIMIPSKWPNLDNIDVACVTSFYQFSGPFPPRYVVYEWSFRPSKTKNNFFDPSKLSKKKSHFFQFGAFSAVYEVGNFIFRI